MLNAIITANDQTAIIEFPIDIFELHQQIGTIGIRQAPHRVMLTDNEEDDVQVKLYSDTAPKSRRRSMVSVRF